MPGILVKINNKNMSRKKYGLYESIVSGIMAHVDSRTSLARHIYSLAKRYCSVYQGENNPDYITNGQQEFYKKLFSLRNTKLVVEVGANMGEMSNYILSLKRGLELHCFEPDPRAFVLLQTKLGFSNAILNLVAIGDKIETKSLYMHKKHSEWNTFHLYPHRHGEFSPRLVKATTLDSYFREKNIRPVDLLKIDTEGHDLFVLKGAISHLRKGLIDVIVFEFGEVTMLSRALFFDTYSYLESLGYRIYKVMPKYLKRVYYSTEDERCFYANFVAVRKNYNIEDLEVVN